MWSNSGLSCRLSVSHFVWHFLVSSALLLPLGCLPLRQLAQVACSFPQPLYGILGWPACWLPSLDFDPPEVHCLPSSFLRCEWYNFLHAGLCDNIIYSLFLCVVGFKVGIIFPEKFGGLLPIFFCSQFFFFLIYWIVRCCSLPFPLCDFKTILWLCFHLYVCVYGMCVQVPTEARGDTTRIICFCCL